MAILLFVALLLVLTTNWLTVLLALGGAFTAAVYPFMKRYTYLPQAILGLAFSFGIPMAFAAVTGEVTSIAGLLMIANILWTVAYDTEYAMVDRDDDLLLGLKSTAILFAELDKAAIGTLQVIFLLVMYGVAKQAGLSGWYLLGLICAAGLFIYQQYLISGRDRDDCFAAFLNNTVYGQAKHSRHGIHRFRFRKIFFDEQRRDQVLGTQMRLLHHGSHAWITAQTTHSHR